jgi:glycosyltransferase involved in cell wall biosynthesis
MLRSLISKIAGDSTLRRIDGLRHELRYAPRESWSKWKASQSYRKKKRALSGWMKAINDHPPDVLVGANVNSRDGIRNHLLGIQRYSKLKVDFSPSDEVMSLLDYHDLHTTFRDIVMDFEPRGIQAIHSHVYPYYIEWCRRHSNKRALWVHTYHLPYFRINESKPLEPWQEDVNNALLDEARHAHVRISVAKWQQEYLEAEHGITTDFIPNGVDVALCDSGQSLRFIEKTGYEGFVLFVGRNDPVKNPADFVKLAKRMPGQRFVMLGAGLTPESIIALSGREGPKNLLVLGPARRIEVQDALAACAAVVVPSIREGLPTVVLEAMTHGKSIVVSDDAGCVEAIDGGKYGFVYRQGDLADMAEKTESAMVDADRRSMARDHILSVYDWRVVAARLDEIYRTGRPVSA